MPGKPKNTGTWVMKTVRDKTHCFDCARET